MFQHNLAYHFQYFVILWFPKVLVPQKSLKKLTQNLAEHFQYVVILWSSAPFNNLLTQHNSIICILLLLQNKKRKIIYIWYQTLNILWSSWWHNAKLKRLNTSHEEELKVNDREFASKYHFNIFFSHNLTWLHLLFNRSVGYLGYLLVLMVDLKSLPMIRTLNVQWSSGINWHYHWVSGS